MLPELGVDPRADSRNGEYVIVKPPGWSEERWDAYQRGLGGGTMIDSAEFEGMWIAVEKYDAVVAENERLRDDAHHLRKALREAIGWSYGGGLTPERRDALERIADAS